MSCLVIGIGGCSNGGKTTLSLGIKEDFKDAVVINMDNFYRKNGDTEIEWLDIYDRTFANWDSLKSFNGPMFLKEFEDVYKRLSESKKQNLLVVEGLFIFEFSEIQKYFFRKYFIDLSLDEALKRRRVREYPRKEPNDYFEKIAWPAYNAIKERVKHQTDMIYLDGTDTRSKLKKFVVSDIKKAMHKKT